MHDTPRIRSARGVQREDVFAAADALLAEGKRPTIERVRLKMGRGSPNTVSPMLEHWFASLGSRMSGATSLAPGPGESGLAQSSLPEGVRTAAAALWGEAQREASTQARSAVARELEDLAQREQSLASAQAALRQREDAFAATRAGVDAALAAAQQTSAALEQQLHATSADAQDVRRRLEAELQRLNTRLSDASQAEQRERQGTAQALADLEKDMRQAEERHAGQQRHWLAEVDRARQQVKAWEVEAAKTRERLRKSEEGATARLERERDKAERLLDTERKEADSMRATLATQAAQLAKLGVEAALADERCTQMQLRYEEERAAHQATRQLLTHALGQRTRGRAAPKSG